MKIAVTFGMALDGARWSDADASLGAIVCGPRGLIDFLETHLGLTGESPSTPDRVDQYKAKIAAADPEWCRASFALDSWGTAKQLLSFRDKIVELGWTPDIGGSRRFEALAAIERAPLPLAPGRGDRLKSLLSSDRKIDASISFADDYNLYPPVWKKVIEKFFDERTQLPVPEAKGGLEVTVVTAPNEVMLAHDFVRYLVAKPDGNEGVTVIAGGDTTLLDEFLHRAGLPAVGASKPSVSREALQILPLWIENMWTPFSPGKFVQLLGVQGSPVPSFMRRELIPALVEAPGIGGTEWIAAWERIVKRAAEFGDAEKRLAQVEELKGLFEGERFDPDGAGIPAKELVRRLEILIGYLRGRIADNEEWKVVITHIRQFIDLLANEKTVNRMSANRMIDTIYGQGLSRANAKSEASAWKVLNGPGQMLDDAETVLWWDFTDQTSVGDYWSPSEREALANVGLSTDEDAALKRDLASWNNAYAHTKTRIICFAPETKGGEPAAVHPFAVNLDARRKKTSEDDRMKVEDFRLFDFETGVWKLADRSVQLVQRPEYLGPEVKATAAELPTNDIVPQRLSVTQLSTLIECPYRWILEKHVKLREAEIAQLPDERQTLGVLAHKIVEMLASPAEASNREPEKAAARAGELFDRLLPERHADLMLPENADKRVRSREVLMTAVKVLFEEIKKRGLQIIEAEKALDGTFEDVPFVGAADLVLKDATGRNVVYDFKWSGNRKYAATVRAGLSIQLAFYSWLLSPEAFDVSSCYYLFPRQKFIPNGQDNRAAYERAVDFYRHRIGDIRSGRVDIGGVEEAGGTSEVYPPLTEEEEQELAAIEDPAEKMARLEEMMETRLPYAYQPDCRYCSCRPLCKLAKGIKEEDEEVAE